CSVFRRISLIACEALLKNCSLKGLSARGADEAPSGVMASGSGVVVTVEDTVDQEEDEQTHRAEALAGIEPGPSA
ncbi:MAG: hypothetical protein ACRCX7_05885, partial [Cetobacterium sp.]|uniref:hypothetical protein n=1 Tax=Cetobacterium sp. TaxID=2071632 RepID=UPI003F35FEA5